MVPGRVTAVPTPRGAPLSVALQSTVAVVLPAALIASCEMTTTIDALDYGESTAEVAPVIAVISVDWIGVVIEY
jgi:hypothetical protein